MLSDTTFGIKRAQHQSMQYQSPFYFKKIFSGKNLTRMQFHCEVTGNKTHLD